MSSPPLTRIIAIPATDLNIGSPFLRSYPIELQSFGISRDKFLQFLDGLNRAIVVSPASAAVGGVGEVIGLVPEPTAQTAGMAIEAVGEIAGEAISKGRSGYLIWQANKEFFGPRGLKAEVAKLNVLAGYANIPILNKEGKVEKSSALLAPLSDTESTSLSVQERRIQVLRPWIGELELVPWEKTDKPKRLMSKLHASTSERQRKSEEKKFTKRRAEALDKEQKKIAGLQAEHEKKMSKLTEEEEKLRLIEKAKEQDLGKTQREGEDDEFHVRDDKDGKGKEAQDAKKQQKSKEKELRELEKKAKRQEEERRKLEQKRSKIIAKYETDTEKVRTDRIKDDREQKAIRGIIWLIIRQV